MENSIKRGNLKSSTIRNVSKVPKWVNQVSIYRPRSSGHLASSKRSSEGFFTKKSRKNTISHDCAKWKVHQHHFCLFGAFRTTVRNQFSLLPFSCSQNPFLVHFARLCEFFACSYEIEKHGFSTCFCHLSHLFLLIPLPLLSNQLQIPVQTDCIASFIMHLDHYQLYLFSSIWFISFVTNLSKSCLEMTPKLHKTC